jgi:hypothetical protein
MMSIRIASVLVGCLMLASVPPPAAAQCVPADCDDRDLCTRDTCLGDFCVHAPIRCNDGNACTTEACNPATGQCQTTSTITCNDNNACSTEACNPATGQCQTTSTITCNDNNACTSEACNPATGQCQTTSITTCNDNNACTTDVCAVNTGQCQYVFWCGFKGDIVIKLTAANVKTTYKTKKSAEGPDTSIKVTLADVVLVSDGGTTRKVKVGVKAVVKGPDADLASLIYPIAALKFGAGAATEMHHVRYDFTGADTGPKCPDLLPADTCATLAQQVSKSTDASLAMGRTEDRDAFRQAADFFGVPPDTCVFIP